MINHTGKENEKECIGRYIDRCITESICYTAKHCKSTILQLNQLKKTLETNKNKNTMTQNLWDAAKAVLRGKFLVIQANKKKKLK